MKTGLLLKGGGIADSIPIDKIMNMGFDKVTVVLTRPIDY